MSMKVNKNGKGYDLGFMPQHYPADRVYLDGDTSKTAQDAIDDLKSYTYTVPSTSTDIDQNNPTTFTAPSYGYLMIYSTNTDTDVAIRFTDGNNEVNAVVARAYSSSMWDFKSLYMRKGMTVKISAGGSHGKFRFIPFD